MSKETKCSCYPPVWLEWENQMEPGYTCQKCREEEYELTNKIEEEKVSPRMQRLIFEKELEHAFIVQERLRLKAKLQQIDKDELPF